MKYLYVVLLWLALMTSLVIDFRAESKQLNAYSLQGETSLVASISRPVDLVADANNSLYVISARTKGIIFIDSKSNAARSLSRAFRRSDGSAFDLPAFRKIAINRQGLLALATEDENLLFFEPETGKIFSLEETAILSNVKRFKRIYGLEFGKDDDIFIADDLDHRIYRASLITGQISVLAGNGKGKYYGDGGRADLASLQFPMGMAFNGSNLLFVADYENHCVRVVNLLDEIISTVPVKDIFLSIGNNNFIRNKFFPKDVAVDRDGSIYILEAMRDRVIKFNSHTKNTVVYAGSDGAGLEGDDIPAINAKLNNPSAIAIDNNGNLLIADWENNCIRQVYQTTGIIKTIVKNK